MIFLRDVIAYVSLMEAIIYCWGFDAFFYVSSIVLLYFFFQIKKVGYKWIVEAPSRQ